MARPAARARMLYYPLPDQEAEFIRQCLIFPPQPCATLDPCAGEGRAMRIITADSSAVRYGIELDSYRADAAAQVLDHVIQGDALSTHCKVESYSLIYANPPFDSEFGETGNQRFEALFLSHFARWLLPGGVLVYVVPAPRLPACAKLLATHFRNVQVFRLESADCIRFKQVVIFATARSQRERARTRDSEIAWSIRRISSLASAYETLPPLTKSAAQLQVPPSGPVQLSYAGLPLDEIEDLLTSSPAYRQIAHILRPEAVSIIARPLSPLHQGHLAILCCAGLLNSVFGSGDRLHVAAWKSKKRIIKTEEQDGEKTIVREREQFFHELALVFANGETALLE
jgi:hypothetical protein